MESDHDDPNLSQEIHSKLKKLVETKTPPELKAEMAGKIDEPTQLLANYLKYFITWTDYILWGGGMFTFLFSM